VIGSGSSLDHEDNKNILAAIQTHRSQALSELGAGYYSFGDSKIIHYQRARSAVGGMVGLIYSLPDPLVTDLRVDWLEEKVLPALSSLLKAMEKNGRLKKKSRANRDNEIS